MARTIESPGVEINERDLSLNATLPVGTNVFVQGFATQGPTDELINITSESELEDIYGLPTNAAERYFYHTCKQVLKSPGNLLATRMPYGSGDGSGYGSYSALVFPATGYTLGETATAFQSASSYVIGQPIQFTLTEDEYWNWKSGLIDWGTGPLTSVLSPEVSSLATAGNAAFIIINDNKITIDEKFQGFYITVADNTNLTDTDYEDVQNIKYVHPNNTSYGTPSAQTWSDISTSVLNFNLTGTYQNDSISEDVELAPGFDGFGSDPYNDSVIITLHKIRTTLYGSSTITTLDKVLTESFMGSFDSRRKWTPPEGGEESFYIGNQMNSTSKYMQIFVNPNIASLGGSWDTDGDGTTDKRIRLESGVKNAWALGPVSYTSTAAAKVIGNIPQKLERSLRLAENREQIPIDIVCDGGVSTIWASTQYTASYGSNSSGIFDDTIYLKGVHEQDTSVGAPNAYYLADQTNGTSCAIQNYWETVFNQLNTFCQSTRKDCLLISDILRNIVVQGPDQKILSDPSMNFSSHVYWPMKNLVAAANSNYACTYGNFVKVYDNNLADFIWLPFSGFQARIMATVDSNLQPWYATAGLNNGIIRDIVDIGINPTQKQRDLLYKISVNPVVFFPGDGYTVWGQKTLQKKPSAFDRINVRRLFLTLEKATLSIARYFVFEPNTVFTRTRVVNVLKPIFEIAKNNEGVYDYLIICDERNNPATVTDNNELVIDIYLKPVRIAEWILVNFVATRTDQDFNELI